ncbi:MAG: ASPIC/UnbV domain-containing protein, partial [Acidobacteriota bacterium]
GVFSEVGAQAGLADLPVYSSRGAAYADFDNDGDIDLVYTNLQAPPTLLENISSNENHWIKIRLIGAESNRQGIGARLKLVAGDLVQHATLRSGESYLSGNDPRPHFGLGKETRVDYLEIRWPSGQIDIIRNLEPDQIAVCAEGQGMVPSSANE